MDQFKFELKCTQRYLTVCSRDNERERELGRSVFGIKEAFRIFSVVYEKSQDDEGHHPTPLDQNICCKSCKARIHQHTLTVCCDGMRGSQYARRKEREKERLTAERPHMQLSANYVGVCFPFIMIFYGLYCLALNNKDSYQYTDHYNKVVA